MELYNENSSQNRDCAVVGVNWRHNWLEMPKDGNSKVKPMFRLFLTAVASIE